MMTENEEKRREYKSDTVTFTIERKPKCMVEYRVKTSPEIVKKTRSEAVKSVSKEVSVRGFRKGRAPDRIILKKFPGPVKERWEKAVVDKTFHECQKLFSSPILSNDAEIHFDIAEHSPEEGVEIIFSFETEPLVPDIRSNGIEIEEVEREVVDEKKLEETLKTIQTYFAEWEKISGRPAKEGDFAVIDVDLIEKEPADTILSNARFEIKRGTMTHWMYEMVVGIEIGASKEGLSRPDEDASEEDKEKFPPKKVRLTLKGIEIPHYPVIDDALAQKMGTKNERELRERLEKLLNTQADEAVRKKYREQISAYLLETYRFELPETLLQRETRFRIKQLVQDVRFQRKLMKMGEDEKKEVIKDLEAQAEKAVRLFYISRQITQDNGIEIGPDEVHRAISTPLEAMFSDQSDLYTAKEQSQEQKAIATSRLLLAKVEDFLISKAKIVPPKHQEKVPSKKKNDEKNGSEEETDQQHLT
ncbi:MAG: trigger factor [Chlamydiota bacterium]